MNKKLIFIAGLVVLFFAFSPETNAQNRPADKTVRHEIRFARGKSSAVIRKKIPYGTTHLYTLRAREGQTMTVILTTGKQTSFTVFSPSSGIIEGADGEKMWRGMLDETGEYSISIGTDKTANYTLEIYIR